MDAIKYVHEQLDQGTEIPEFKPGDQIEVVYRIVEGSKERPQAFRGTVLQTNGTGGARTFTVRKVSSGIGVERIFPFNSPHIISVEVIKQGKVRRSKLFYLRERTGKKARIKERKTFNK